METDVQLINEITDYDFNRIIERFKDDAIEEWDRLVGHLPAFGTFIQFYVNQRWAWMIRSN